MKNIFGKILVCFLLVCLVPVFADPPVVDTLSFICGGQSIGFIGGVWCPVECYELTFIVIGTHPDGDYLAMSAIDENGSIVYSGFRVHWNENMSKWQGGYCGVDVTDQCVQDWVDYVLGLSDTERQNPQTIYDAYFPPELPESRLPMDDDLDGDGMLDYYDLDCPAYDDYIEYCELNDLDALDMVDYLNWYQNELDDYLALRQNTMDTDGDGFSDGYEEIHGTSMYDGSEYPLGIPDTGSSLLIVGGQDEQEPWRQEEYNDSGYSRGFVYDQGYDPFGDTSLTFEDDPDWGLLDSDNDGLVNNAELANGTDPYKFEFQSGFSYIYNEDGGYYSVTGYTEDGAFGDYGNAPTAEEYLADDSLYDVGDYAYQPSEFTFGIAEYDDLLNATDKIKPNFDDVRPAMERDYKLTFAIPFPGGMESFTISVMPDTSNPAGAAMEIVRQLVRGFTAVVFSYVFVKHVWLAIRQY